MLSAAECRLCDAVLVHPVSADAPAGGLPWRDDLSAALALIASGAGRDDVRQQERIFRPAEPCRAEGRYRKTEATRAEVGQVRGTHPHGDVCWPRPGHVSLNLALGFTQALEADQTGQTSPYRSADCSQAASRTRRGS